MVTRSAPPRILVFSVIIGMAMSLLVAAVPASAAEAADTVLIEVSPGTQGAVAAEIAKIGATSEGTLSNIIDAVRVTGTPSEIARIEALNSVVSVVRDSPLALMGQQDNAPWNLSRLDQTALPVDDTYFYPDSGGSGVFNYVVDTGIKENLQELGNRVSPGKNFYPLDPNQPVTDPSNTVDCQGHGTHVAGIISSETYGVAKNSTVVPVRVFGCAGGTSVEYVLAALDWIITDPNRPDDAKSVVNMSLGGPSNQWLDDAVDNMVGFGFTVTVAAGNGMDTDNDGYVDTAADSCGFSPSGTPNAITVGASTQADKRLTLTNFGSCVDVFAPGSLIPSLNYDDSTTPLESSGTSMAAPHAAGIASLILGQNPTFTPAQVLAKIIEWSVAGAISDGKSGDGDRLVQVLASAVQPPPAPIGAGAFDSAVGVPGGIQISGWSLDQTTSASTYIWVNVNGSGGAFRANKPLSWIPSLFPGLGTDHGFSEKILKAPGQYQVCVSGSTALLGCKTVTVR